MASFETDILILCKTYPSPSGKHVETSCVAGMKPDGSLSRLVLQLEKQLGVSLFLRSTRNVVLTAPGREFTVSARRLIEDLNIQVENARALGGQVRGRLIISCLLSLTHQVVPHAVLRYRKAHPGVEIH